MSDTKIDLQEIIDSVYTSELDNIDKIKISAGTSKILSLTCLHEYENQASAAKKNEQGNEHIQVVTQRSEPFVKFLKWYESEGRDRYAECTNYSVVNAYINLINGG